MRDNRESKVNRFQHFLEYNQKHAAEKYRTKREIFQGMTALFTRS